MVHTWLFSLYRGRVGGVICSWSLLALCFSDGVCPACRGNGYMQWNLLYDNACFDMISCHGFRNFDMVVLSWSERSNQDSPLHQYVRYEHRQPRSNGITRWSQNQFEFSSGIVFMVQSLSHDTTVRTGEVGLSQRIIRSSLEVIFYPPP